MLVVVGLVEWSWTGTTSRSCNSTELDWDTPVASRRAGPEVRRPLLRRQHVKFGLNHRVIEARTGRKAANLAVVGGSAASSYFLLRCALDAGARPRTIVVDFCKDLLLYEPSSTKTVFPWYTFVDLRESVALCWASRDTDLFAGSWSNASCRRRVDRLEIPVLRAVGVLGHGFRAGDRRPRPDA